MYDIERYYQARDAADAIRALAEDPAAVVISGGSDVLIKIREGRLAGCSLVSIHGIEELAGISMEENGLLRIGPGATFSHITNHPLIQKHIPVLGEAADLVGGPQIRNTGTIGGNVCNGVTSADSASTLLALNAVLELTGPEGSRSVPLEKFYTGPGKTVRAHEELLTGILISRENYKGYYGSYMKYGKRAAMEIATMGCAAVVKLSEDKKRVKDLRLAYGVAAPTPIRCHRTEDRARKMALNEALLDMAGAGVLEEINPRTSWRASREFRIQLAVEMTRRVLREAIVRGGGEITC